MNEPNTLDEQIDKWMIENLTGEQYDQLKALFTEHSKQARIDELEHLICNHTPHIQKRLNQLKRNKGDADE